MMVRAKRRYIIRIYDECGDVDPEYIVVETSRKFDDVISTLERAVSNYSAGLIRDQNIYGSVYEYLEEVLKREHYNYDFMTYDYTLVV